LQFILLICIVIYAVYHVANYAHARDTKFGQSFLAKTIVVTAIILYLVNICVVPIDIELSGKSDTA